MTLSLYRLFYSQELSRTPLIYNLYRNIGFEIHNFVGWKKLLKKYIEIKIVNHYLCKEYMHTKCVMYVIDDCLKIQKLYSPNTYEFISKYW